MGLEKLKNRKSRMGQLFIIDASDCSSFTNNGGYHCGICISRSTPYCDHALTSTSDTKITTTNYQR